MHVSSYSPYRTDRMGSKSSTYTTLAHGDRGIWGVQFFISFLGAGKDEKLDNPCTITVPGTPIEQIACVISWLTD